MNKKYNKGKILQLVMFVLLINNVQFSKTTKL